MKKALITGINGQDGSYLAELLLEKNYEVYGIVRRESIENVEKLKNLKNIKDKIHLVTCSLDNALSVYKLFNEVKPDECYHLAANSFVSYSMEEDLAVMNNNFTSTYNLLMSILDICPQCKLYFAGSSEIFGNAEQYPQDENCRYNPRSIYGISKLASHLLVKNYRERFGLFACTGFAYNHESPRRGLAFVTRKITSSVAEIALGKNKIIELGDIEAQRDWGYAPEYVEAMYLMLNTKEPKDYVLATGVLHSVKNILKVAFDYIGEDYGKHIKIKDEFIRQRENIPLVGNAEKISIDLGWKANKKFEDIIKEMVQEDIKRIEGRKLQ